MSEGFTKTEAALLEALERERGLLRERELINGIILHELANAVTIVAGTTDLLLTSDHKSTLFEFALMRLRGGTRTLSDILGGLRILMDRAEGQPVFAAGDLDSFVRSTVTDPVLIADTAQRRVEFVNRAAGVTGAFCASLLRHALANLVRNALKYSPATSPVCVVLIAKGNQRWIHVKNRGPKIASEVASHIFEPGKKGANGGMGLGLHITRACARKMGGELRFGSTRKATVFSLLLPWREASPESLASAILPPNASAPAKDFRRAFASPAPTAIPRPDFTRVAFT